GYSARTKSMSSTSTQQYLFVLPSRQKSRPLAPELEGDRVALPTADPFDPRSMPDVTRLRVCSAGTWRRLGLSNNVQTNVESVLAEKRSPLPLAAIDHSQTTPEQSERRSPPGGAERRHASGTTPPRCQYRRRCGVKKRRPRTHGKSADFDLSRVATHASSSRQSH